MDSTNQDQQHQADDGLPSEFSVDDTIEVWTRAMRQFTAEIRRLKIKTAFQQRLIDTMESRIEKLEGRGPTMPVGTA